MFERIYAIHDYYDQPRSGIAACLGEPYFYDREFDEDSEDFSDTYFLTPLDKETLSLALAGWELWLEWKRNHGATELWSHPFIAPQSSRYAKCVEIHETVQERVAAIQAGRKRAKAKFRVRPDGTNTPMSQSDNLEVEWSHIEDL